MEFILGQNFRRIYSRLYSKLFLRGCTVAPHYLGIFRGVSKEFSNFQSQKITGIDNGRKYERNKENWSGILETQTFGILIMKLHSSLQGWFIIHNFIRSMQKELDQMMDESFMVNNRLITASHCTVSDLSNIQLDKGFKVGPGDFELKDDLQNYIKTLFNSEAKSQLMMTINKIAQGNAALLPYIQKSAQKLRIGDKIPSYQSPQFKEYWSAPVQSKKCTIRTFIKPNHEYLNNQILYFHFRDHPGSGNSDVLVRSSRGEILMVLWNCKISEVEGKLASKLKHIEKSSIFCVFINQSKSRTVNLAYFDHLTKNDVGFLCLNKKIKVNPDYISFRGENSFLSLRNNPKIYIFQYKGETIVGSHQAIQLGLNGSLDQLFERFNQNLQKQTEWMRAIPIHQEREFEHKTIELKYVILNLLIIEQSRNHKTNINHVVMNILQYCFSRTATIQEKQLDNSAEQVSHFPIILKHCKQCRACLKSFKEETKNSKKKMPNNLEASDYGEEKSKKLKIRKTKYQCQSCSFQQGKPVPLCVLCFKRYHRNITQYTDFPVDLSNYFSSKGKRKKQKKVGIVEQEYVKVEGNPTPVASQGTEFLEIALRVGDKVDKLFSMMHTLVSPVYQMPHLITAQQLLSTSSESSTGTQVKQIKQQIE